MRRGFVALCALTLVAGSACGNLFSPAAAVVDGKKLTTGEVEEAFDLFARSDQYEELIATGDPKAIQRQFEQFYLTRLIRRAVFEPRAADLGITFTGEDVNKRIEQIKSTYPSEEEFQTALSGQGLNNEQLRKFVEDRILEQRLRAKITGDAAPTEEELRAYYEANIDAYTETRVAHILVDDEALAQQLSDRLQAAPAKRPTRLFASLARKHSTDGQSKGDGGDLGYLLPGQNAVEFDDAVAELEPGEISEAVRTNLGYHVIYVTDRRPQPYEDVREAISVLIGSPVEEKAWTDWVLDAFEEADVKVNPKYGELDLETQQIVNASTETVPGTAPEVIASPDAPLLSPEPSP